jgi:hypothetical protein
MLNLFGLECHSGSSFGRDKLAIGDDQFASQNSFVGKCFDRFVCNEVQLFCLSLLRTQRLGRDSHAKTFI